MFIVLTQFLFWYFILPFAYKESHSGYESPKLSGDLFLVLVLASVCIAAAGYIINDYFDVDIDLVNKSSKVIIGTFIKKRSAILLHGFLSSVGLALSLYLGYNIVQEEKFSNSAEKFIHYEARFPNDYLLSKVIDPKKRMISLVYGGKEITPDEINELKGKMKQYGIEKDSLEIKQGFAYLAPQKDNHDDDRYALLSNALAQKEKQESLVLQKLDSIQNEKKLSAQVYSELKVQYPKIKSAVIEPSTAYADSAKAKKLYLVLIEITGRVSAAERKKMEEWLKVRLQQQHPNDSLSLILH